MSMLNQQYRFIVWEIGLNRRKCMQTTINTILGKRGSWFKMQSLVFHIIWFFQFNARIDAWIKEIAQIKSADCEQTTDHEYSQDLG